MPSINHLLPKKVSPKTNGSHKLIILLELRNELQDDLLKGQRLY
jgi:hypothetical protein